MATVDISRFIGRYSIGRDSNPLNVTGSLHFLRIKVPGGFITSEQFRRVAELAQRYSKGRIEITDRQDIQLHWIEAEDALEIFSVMDKLGFTTDMCGQGFTGARYGDPRNIVCCPVSGVEKNELLNGYLLMKKLSKFFVGNLDFLDMPKKFKFSISGCGCNCTRAEINDLAFVAVEKENEVGFTLLAGGSSGASLPGPRLAKPLDVFVKPEDAFDVAIAAIEIHRDYGNRERKAKARFKWLFASWGLEKFLEVLQGKLGKTLESYDGPTFLRHGDHEGVQQQGQEGYYYVNTPLLGGILSSDQMISIADLADEYGNGDLRLTPSQNLVIPNVKEKDTLLKRLEETGFSLNGSKLRWTSIGCSSDFCGKTQSPHAKEVLKEIVDHLEKHFEDKFLDEAGFRIHVSGCPNNCCASLIAEIGLEGRLIRENGEMKQTYNILFGGGFGSKPSLERLVERRVPAGEVKSKIEALLTNYRKKSEPSEDLKEFCNRHTIEELISYMN
jgi:sulfite reductase (ferredoxin)